MEVFRTKLVDIDIVHLTQISDREKGNIEQKTRKLGQPENTKRYLEPFKTC